MPSGKLRNAEIVDLVVGRVAEFPKYTTQIMNLANQNAQGTRPRIVGQMTDLFSEFSGTNFEEWRDWYHQKKPGAIDDATNRVYSMLQHLREAIQLIDKQMVREWVEDLVIVKTFVGLCFQEALIARVAEMKGCAYRLADAEEESQGIDGYIGDTPISVKPATYATKDMLSETIDARMIVYDKKKDGVSFTFDF